MKPHKVFLFYYSLVATTILLLVSFFLLPKPKNIANTVLLAPVVFFLWTHALNPDFFSAPKWSPKFGAIVLVFLLLGIFHASHQLHDNNGRNKTNIRTFCK